MEHSKLVTLLPWMPIFLYIPTGFPSFLFSFFFAVVRDLGLPCGFEVYNKERKLYQTNHLPSTGCCISCKSCMKLWFTNKYKATERRKLSYGVPNTTLLVNLVLITISNLVVIYNYFHYSCNLSYLFNFLKLDHLKYFLKLKWIKEVWVLSCHEQGTNKKYWVFISTWTPNSHIPCSDALRLRYRELYFGVYQATSMFMSYNMKMNDYLLWTGVSHSQR